MEIFTTQYILKALLQLGVMWFSLSLHEFGHAFAADKLGDPTPRMLGRLTVSPFAHMDLIGTVLIPILRYVIPGWSNFLIGWAKPVPISPVNFRHPRRDEMLVSIAGPGANIVLMAFFTAVLWVGDRAGWFASTEGMTPQFLNLAGYFVILNFCLALFNLIPIPPLDGHWILKSILPGKWSYHYSRFAPYGIYLVLLLMVLGWLDKILLPFYYLLFGAMDLMGLGEIWNRIRI
jgi:Zn-dependent protease